jgi:hypothetical protein
VSDKRASRYKVEPSCLIIFQPLILINNGRAQSANLRGQ